jgi:hypothetical protein
MSSTTPSPEELRAQAAETLREADEIEWTQIRNQALEDIERHLARIRVGGRADLASLHQSRIAGRNASIGVLCGSDVGLHVRVNGEEPSVPLLDNHQVFVLVALLLEVAV